MDPLSLLTPSAEVECIFSTSERVRGVVHCFDRALRIVVLTSGPTEHYRLVNTACIREVRRTEGRPSQPTTVAAKDASAKQDTVSKAKSGANTPAGSRAPSGKRVDVKLPQKGG